jgi:acyl-CoA thioesterase FadM
MERLKIILPNSFDFTARINVRITDLNYGNHLANHNILSYAHEARVQMYQHYNLDELNFAGVGLIQADAAVVFRKEVFYGDVLNIQMKMVISGSSSFDIFYRFDNQEGACIAELRTRMVCFDYEKRKPVFMPEKAVKSGLFSDI